MRVLVDVVFVLGLVLGWPVWRRKPRADWAGRWGRVEALGDAASGRVVVHAVSVGEVNASVPVVRRLLGDGRFEGVDVVVSVTTDTGTARARGVFGGAEWGGRVRVVRYPLDASWAVRRWFERVKPSVVVLVELEVWPNFLVEAGRRGVGVCVVNGRLSERSFRNYRRMRWAVGWMFRRLRVVCAQDGAYAARFREMGCGDVRELGSVKWDAALDGVASWDGSASVALRDAMGLGAVERLVVLGSAEPGEAALFRGVLEDVDGVGLLVAPRKPEWFDGVEEELGGVGVVRRSRGDRGVAGSRWFLLDTIGELRAAYGLCDVAVVGRSFGALYGSDVMEPAALGRAVVVGPRVGDFEASVAALERAGGLLRTTRESVGEVLRGLLADGDRRDRMGERARACVASEAGAACASVGVIAEVMGVDRG